MRGKGTGVKGADCVRWDHPRVCGEKYFPMFLPPRIRGSPPRVRGKVGFFGRSARLTGITPACAGKSEGRCSYGSSIKDHPRVCGEKNPALVSGVCVEGSPPRVRGKGRLGLTID